MSVKYIHTSNALCDHVTGFPRPTLETSLAIKPEAMLGATKHHFRQLMGKRGPKHFARRAG
jgi:hypothetical protein